MPITTPIPNSPNGTSRATPPNIYYGSGRNNWGEYQFVQLSEIIDNFMAIYVGEGRLLPNSVFQGDVRFHASRAIQELSYDTLKSCKSLEIEVCPNLKVPLPHDYVNYTKLTWVDENGIEHIIYPTNKTSNPFAVEQTQTDCKDCGDTSQTYQINGGELVPQEIDCDTEDRTCTFVNPTDFVLTSLPNRNFDVIFGTDPLGANQVGQAFQSGGNASSFTTAQHYAYWQAWFASVDNYCLCLAAAGSENNCGERLDWDGFNTLPTNVNYTSEMNNHAGWSGLRSPVGNPDVSRTQAVNGTWNSFTIEDVQLSTESSNTWDNYKSSSPNQVAVDQSTTTDLAVDTDNYFQNTGRRFGLEPQYAQTNGSYFIDCHRGMIHFSSNLSGKTVIIHYLSDHRGKGDEQIVPKLAEEAVYKWIAYGCLSTRSDIPEYVIQRFKKEKFAETRKAKIRISNIKIEEIAQVMRGRSKWIKH